MESEVKDKRKSFDELKNFIMSGEHLLVLVKDLSGNALTIESIWHKCNGPSSNENKSFHQINNTADGFNFIIDAAKKNDQILVTVLNEWLKMIHTLWPHIEEFFSSPIWKRPLAQYIIGVNHDINIKLYPSMQYLYQLNSNSTNGDNKEWDSIFNMSIAKQNLLAMKLRIFSQFNKFNSAIKTLNIDTNSFDKINIHVLYRLFIDNVTFIQFMLSQRHIFNNIMSFIDRDLFSKISNLPNVDFIDQVFANFDKLAEIIDTNINSLLPLN
jgi:hypothetical protein